MPHLIRPCRPDESDAILAIVNDAARAYAGIIPVDRYREPYMSADALAVEIAAGVIFWGYEADGTLFGVMGIQDVQNVTLIRHAYVASKAQGVGIGGALLAHLRPLAPNPMLIGTWAAADWAIGFYEKHGFKLVPRDEVPELLNRYWSIPARQVETSVVLGAPEWFGRAG